MVIPDFYYEDNYNVGLHESIKLHAKARVNKGLKKKKVYNSKLVWSSSDESNKSSTAWSWNSRKWSL